MGFLRIVMASVVVLCGLVLAGMVAGVGIYFAVTLHLDWISQLRILLFGAFGLWAAAYMCVFAAAVFRGGTSVAAGGKESASGLRGVRTLTTIFYVLVSIAVALFFETLGPLVPILAGLFLFVVVSGFVLVGLHEIGHVLAAHLVGIRPVTMRVGTGREWASFRMGVTRVSLGMNVFSGFVQAVNDGGTWTRGRCAVFALGGPMASLATFLAIAGLYYFLGLSRFLPAVVPPHFFEAVFVGQNVVMFCGFFEAEMVLDGKKLKPDMTLVLACLFGSEKDWQASGFDPVLLQEHINRGEWSEAWKMSEGSWPADPRCAAIFAWFAIAIEKDAIPILERLVNDTLEGGKPDATQRPWLLFARGACLAHQGKIDLASGCFAEALEHAPDVEAKVAISEQVANLVICGRLMECLPDALRLSELALQLHPEEITLKGTHGSLLVEMGRIEEAATVLDSVFRETQSENDKVICAFYLALVSLQKGDTQAVQNWREEMLLRNPPKWLRERLSELEG